jgi:hypothetical protein
LFREGGVVVLDGVGYELSSVELNNGVTLLKVLGQTSEHDVSSLLVSMRSIPKEGSKTLRTSSSVLTDKAYVLVRYVVSEGLGYELTEGVDYLLNGDIVSLTRGVEVGEEYYLKHTAQGAIGQRVLSTGEVEYPKYELVFTEKRVPTEHIGKKIYAKCMVYAPDVFYFRTVAEQTYEGELQIDLLDSLKVNEKRGFGAKTKRSENTQRGRSFGYFDLLASDVVAFQAQRASSWVTRMGCLSLSYCRETSGQVRA